MEVTSQEVNRNLLLSREGPNVTNTLVLKSFGVKCLVKMNRLNNSIAN